MESTSIQDEFTATVEQYVRLTFEVTVADTCSNRSYKILLCFLRQHLIKSVISQHLLILVENSALKSGGGGLHYLKEWLVLISLLLNQEWNSRHWCISQTHKFGFIFKYLSFMKASDWIQAQSRTRNKNRFFLWGISTNHRSTRSQIKIKLQPFNSSKNLKINKPKIFSWNYQETLEVPIYIQMKVLKKRWEVHSGCISLIYYLTYFQAIILRAPPTSPPLHMRHQSFIIWLQGELELLETLSNAKHFEENFSKTPALTKSWGFTKQLTKQQIKTKWKPHKYIFFTMTQIYQSINQSVTFYL